MCPARANFPAYIEPQHTACSYHEVLIKYDRTHVFVREIPYLVKMFARAPHLPGAGARALW